jgi:hypothetical protein
MVFIFGLALCQPKYGNIWVTGAGGGMVHFNNSTNITTSHPIPFIKYFTSGNSNICDSNGNLILISDGYNIYDTLGNFIDGGDTLIPKKLYNQGDGFSNMSQTSIFLPMDSNKYYFITPTASDSVFDDCKNNGGDCHFDLLLYNVIDMNANNGAGKVVKRMIPALEKGNLRKTQMMACRHANGKDWWLLKNEGDSANVHTFLFTQDSVYDKGVQTFNQIYWDIWDGRGQSVFNSVGNQFATVSQGILEGYVFIANFDRCYGTLSNPKVIQMPMGSQHHPTDSTLKERKAVGLAYSPNGQFLYVISVKNIYQYDLQDNTWFHVAGLDTTAQQFTDYETAYLAPDNKIYIGNWAGTCKQMSRIDNPDVKGVGCNFCRKCLRLDSLTGFVRAGTPPCMPNYGLGTRVCYPESTEQLIMNNEELIIFPNPSNNIFYIKNKKGKKKEMYNSVGELVLSTIKEEINVSHFSIGVYYLKCENVVKKVVVE